MERRSFVLKTAQGAAAAGCGGLLWWALLAQQAHAGSVLRPPGALAGTAFAARCIKCGQCVQACPYHTLKLLTTSAQGGGGTPSFVPRQVPCLMCEHLPCVRACPTGALDPLLTDVRRARMGLAVVDPEHCLSWQGLRCEVCVRACPVKGQAISIANHPRQTSKHAMFVPVVHSEACTGCGVCEAKCPTELAAIRVVDPQLVQGRIGAHYRLSQPTSGGDAAATAPAAAADIASPPPATGRSPAAATQPGAPAPGGADSLDYLNRGARP